MRLSSRNAWLLEQSVDFSNLLVELSQQVFVRLDLDLLVMMVFMNGNVMLTCSQAFGFELLVTKQKLDSVNLAVVT